MIITASIFAKTNEFPHSLKAHLVAILRVEDDAVLAGFV